MASYSGSALKRAMMPVEKATALRHYEEFMHAHGLTSGPATVEQLAKSSAGIQGWLNYTPVEVADGGSCWSFADAETKKVNAMAQPGLNGLWAKQRLLAFADVEWEKVTFTVDSGASDTVVPPSVVRFPP